MPAPPRRTRARAPRVRRDPDEARAIILAAAEELFAERGPDAVGLKDVARAAGVSHALVSHYFGTFGGLVEAALERRAATVRAQIFEQLLSGNDELKPGDLLERLWDALNDPVAMRLGAWALLSGRVEGEQFFPKRVQGLKLVVDGLEKRIRARRGERLSRDDIEVVVTIAVSFTFGYALLRNALQGSLGRAPNERADAELRARFIDLIEGYLAKKR